MTVWERELKLCLPREEDYQNLYAALQPAQKNQIQTNHYFDTKDRQLMKDKIMLRLRVVLPENSWVLCAKWSAKQQDGFFSAREWECELPPDLGAALVHQPETFPEVLATLNSYPEVLRCEGVFQRIAWLENNRSEFLYETHTLELDRTSFPDGHVDYELECETEHEMAVRQSLCALFKRLAIPWEPQEKSKYRRLLERMAIV